MSRTIFFIAVLIFSATQVFSQKSDTIKIDVGKQKIIIIKNLRTGIESLEKAKEDLEKQLGELEDNLDEIDIVIKDLKEQKDEDTTDTVDQNIAVQKSKKEDLEKQIEALRNGIDGIQDEIDNLKDDLDNEMKNDDDADEDWDDNDWGGSDHKYRNKKHKRYYYAPIHWGGVEVGFANFGPKNFNNFNLTNIFDTQTDFMEPIPERSLVFNINFAETSFPLITRYFRFVTGTQIKFINYSLKQNIDLYEDSTGVIRAMPVDPNVRDYTKNNLNIAYLQVPVILELTLPAKAYDRNIFISAGFQGGVKVFSRTKQVYKINGDKYKNRVYSDYQINPFVYGLTARLGIGPIRMFVEYNISELFKHGKGPELYPLNMGMHIDF